MRVVNKYWAGEVWYNWKWSPQAGNLIRTLNKENKMLSSPISSSPTCQINHSHSAEVPRLSEAPAVTGHFYLHLLSDEFEPKL